MWTQKMPTAGRIGFIQTYLGACGVQLWSHIEQLL